MKIANKTARLGEEKACEFLKKNGYKIIERNFRKGYGEIDIIALDGDILVFIEVKTRSSDKFGEPLEAITYFKHKSLIKTAYFYKRVNPKLPESLRIDAVCVKITNGHEVGSIELVKNISGF
ncbi:MAG: YraN family protein [Candidatus Levybacteria bacterium]|nr:YraN family protein [Candidatus Levybacteria bacterium]